MEITRDILQQFRQAQLDELYAVAYAPLHRFAARQLGDVLDYLAEDCVQDAIFAAYQRREQFSQPWQLKGFLYTAIHNNVVSALRKQGSQSNYLNSPDVAERLVDDSLRSQIIEQEALDYLYRVIDSLPEDLREVFELNFAQGLKLAEVANRLGLSESGAKRRRARLLNYLRDRMNGNDALFQVLIFMATN